MKNPMPLKLIASTALLFSVSIAGYSQYYDDTCHCKWGETRKIIYSKTYNSIPEYDTSTFTVLNFYGLDKDTNKMLWFRDIESIAPTKFTPLWDAYAPNNYHASKRDFINYYEGRKDIELAFQFGPNNDQWGYHSFVVRRVGGCYVVTRSYFRHARFVYKAWAILDCNQLDYLFSFLKRLPMETIPPKEGFHNRGYFVDNRHGGLFSIDFESEKGTFFTSGYRQSQREIQEMWAFLDNWIKWIRTYSL